jgi:hypothetical protein
VRKSGAPNSVKFGTLLKLASPPGAAVLNLLRCSSPMDQLSGHIDGNYSENDNLRGTNGTETTSLSLPLGYSETLTAMAIPGCCRLYM